MHIYIFISYGHDKYADRTRMFYEQLCKSDENFAIWWDNKLEVSDDWIIEIEKHLNRLIENNPDSCFIYVITPYSANTIRDNFCIKEIVKALGNNIRVIPVKLADAPLPLLLGNIQWLDFSDINIVSDNPEFVNRMENLSKIIKEHKKLSGDGKQAVLMSKLEPCTFSLELHKHLKNYETRQWLLKSVRDWIENGSRQILLLLGGPGTGKTAFSIWMSYSELSEYVCAWHLCQYSDKYTCDLRNAVKSLAYYLSTRIPAFYKNMEIADVAKVLQEAEFDGATLFKYLILNPLQKIESPDKTVVILIDALDEATQDNHNGLAEIISIYAGQFPRWLKIIITSRNDSSITTYLKEISEVINLDDENLSSNSAEDIQRYVGKMLNASSSSIQKVTAESGNNFLYAQLLCDTIRQNPNFASGELPLGINGYYYSYIRRYFTNNKFTFDDHALPLLHLILTAYEPLHKEVIYGRLHEVCGDWCVNHRVFNNLLKCFGPLLKEVNGCILPFHKSLFDWLLDDKKNEEYAVSKMDGLEVMTKWGLDIMQDLPLSQEDIMTRHFYRYLPQYMIEAGYKQFESFYVDIDFWQRRQQVLGVNLLLKTMIEELSLCSPAVKEQLFANEAFFSVLNLFNIDLFNTGRYTYLHKMGYVIPMYSGMDDDRRLFAIRYYYINELYDDIDANVSIFEEPYQNHIVEAMLMNELGQTYRKLGQLERSAQYYRRSLKKGIEYGGTLDETIYTRLNLSRILTMQCRHQEARQLLDEALEEFYSNRWKDSILGVDFEFSSQQLIRAVRYVELETENFSVNPNDNICKQSLNWANELYADPVKRDRYYANHLIGKLFYMIKTGKTEGLSELLKECEQSINSQYDSIRFACVRSLLLLSQGKNQESLQMATDQLNALLPLSVHQIQRTELAAIVGYLTNSDQTALISKEFVPWYQQVQRIINIIISENNKH